MIKEKLICFRASRDLYEALSTIAKEERRSLSSTIELALIKNLNERKAFKHIISEKRQFSRKTFSAPVVISRQDPKQMGIGTVQEISLGGIGVMLSHEFIQSMRIDFDNAQFEIVFNLPHDKRPVTLVCETKRVVDSKDCIHIGAAFINADFQSYKSLNTYLS
jgi:hypothetical protein